MSFRIWQMEKKKTSKSSRMIRVLPLGTAKLCSLSPLTRMSSCSSPPPDSTYPLMFHVTPLDLVVSTLFFFSWIGWLNRLIFALAHTWDFTPRTTMGRTPWRLNSAGPHGFFTPNRYLHTLQVVSVSSTIAVIFFFHVISRYQVGEKGGNCQISQE